MSDHAWAQEHVGASISGCLTHEEQERFDRHVGDCRECAQELDDARTLEEGMTSLFAGVRPAADLAERTVARLQKAPLPRRAGWSMAIRAVSSAAAVVLVGILGAAMHALASDGDLPFPGTMRMPSWGVGSATFSANNLKQMGLAKSDLHDNTRSMREDASDGEKGGKSQMLGEANGEKVPDDGRVLLGGIGGLAGPDQAKADPTNLDIHNGRTHERLARQANQARGDQLMEMPSDGPNNQALRLGELDKAGVPSLGFSPDGKALVTGGRHDNDGEWGFRSYITGPGSRTEGTLKAQRMLERNISEEALNSPTLVQPIFSTKVAADYFKPTEGSAQTPNNTPLVASSNPFLPPLPVPSPSPTGAQVKPDNKKPLLADPSVGRKIIRTGDMEFVVDSFDAAVDAVNRLIAGLKGAFVATVNSDKLPNGKMRGAVVVRMPPQNLDKFILDLRRDLAKSGELKNQRIGSQDITKQYTDIESRLRAARGMEERLLNIIKTGKGEIKDLVAAERELGIWRTKIEEMEGEIRYFGNQVALSTLTINFTEKEIQAPSALVVTERVGMRIETEDVEKAQQAAVAAVAEVKGRVTKSELKQHAVGQLEAIVHAEVAPAQAAAFRAAIGKLGIVRHQDSQRTQQTEGGSGPPQELKPRFNNVVFEVTLYNTANIQPRETFNMLLTTLDVPASYRKLHDAVTQANGKVRVGNLNEQDRRNTTAQLDFDVPAGEKQTIDKVIGDVGQIFSRSNAQVAVTEVATDRKVGYRITVRNTAGIPARETVTLTVEVKDVDKQAAELKELVRAGKGRVAGDDIDRQPNGQVTAFLVFDVPLKSEEALVRQFKDAGKSVSYKAKQNPQVPDNELATANIVLTLTGTSPIVPSDQGLWNNIRTSLYFSFVVLSWSVMFIILGLCVVLPWAIVIWIIIKLARKMRGKPPLAA